MWEQSMEATVRHTKLYSPLKIIGKDQTDSFDLCQ